MILSLTYMSKRIIAFLSALIWSSGSALNDKPMTVDYSAESSALSSIKLTKTQVLDGVRKGSFSHDGTRLVLIDRNYADVTEIATRRKLAHIVVANGMLLAAEFSPDSQIVATTYRIGQNTKATLWDASSGREKVTLAGIDNDWRRPLDDLSFSPDGHLLASSLGGIARLWDTATAKEVRRFVPESGPPDKQAERALLSPDGKWLMAYFISPTERTYKKVHLWNLESGKQQEFETEIYLDWQFSADSKLLVLTATVDKGKQTERSVAEIWDVDSGSRLKVIEVQPEWRGAFTVAFSPDMKAIAIGGYKRFGIFAIDSGELLVSETHHQSRFFQDSNLPDEVNDIEFSPDGRLLLTGGNDLTVKLWRIVLG